jgi:hypothetical protein
LNAERLSPVAMSRELAPLAIGGPKARIGGSAIHFDARDRRAQVRARTAEGSQYDYLAEISSFATLRSLTLA